MNEEVTVIRENPLRLSVAFDALGEFALLLQLQTNLVGDSLDLTRIRPAADDKVVGERRDAPEVKHLDAAGFLRFRGANRDEPSFLLLLSQFLLPLLLWYYNAGAV